MRALPTIPNTGVATIARWTNFHHTIVDRKIPAFLTPGSAGMPAGIGRGAAFSSALNSILEYCMADPPERLCTMGSRWSLSNILDPGNVVLDPGVWNEVAAVDGRYITQDYQNAAASRGGTPVVMGGASNIGTLNQVLGRAGLALQVSGASDGHRIAGAVATGTHGSHITTGAMHDMVLGVYLVTGPNQAVLLQPTLRSFKPELAQWFQDTTGLNTQDLADDALFQAATVALGSLGFVHSLIIEAVPLYEWHGQGLARTLTDDAVWAAIDTLDTSGLDPTPNPDYFALVLSPYAGPQDHGCTATLLWKKPASRPFDPADPRRSPLATDLTRLLSKLIPIVDAGITASTIGHVIAQQTSNNHPAARVDGLFPGTLFGPTVLPEGNGRSTEIAVNQVHAGAAVRSVLSTLQREAKAGRHLLGGINVRFSPKTRAWLGMNIHDVTTYIELPGLNSADVGTIHRAVWDALRAANISFTTHWGQQFGVDRAGVDAYYGPRVQQWIDARQRLLPSAAARAVFTNPLLQQLGIT